MEVIAYLTEIIQVDMIVPDKEDIMCDSDELLFHQILNMN